MPAVIGFQLVIFELLATVFLVLHFTWFGFDWLSISYLWIIGNSIGIGKTAYHLAVIGFQLVIFELLATVVVAL